MAGQARTVTITGAGTESVTFGDAVLGGAVPSAFALTGNTYSGATLSHGQTCTLTVTPQATALGEQLAQLDLPDNTAAGKKSIRLSLNGVDPRSYDVSPTSIWFDNQDVGEYGTPSKILVSASGQQPVTFGTAAISGSGAASFEITADSCSGATLTMANCEISVRARPVAVGAQDATLTVPSNSTYYPTRTVGLTVMGQKSAKGTYYPVAPARLLDTRSGNGAPKAALGPQKFIDLQVTGRAGIPAAGCPRWS